MSRREKAKEILKGLKKLAADKTQTLSINELRIIIAIECLIGRLVAHKKLSEH